MLPTQSGSRESHALPSLGRRQLLTYAAFGSAALATAGMQTLPAAEGTPQPRRKYAMKKSINLWAFPYPGKMTLTECLQLAKNAGFDGIELNYDLDSDLSPKSGTKEFHEIRRTAERIG
ncbi:MAG TPA: sugar phosphate isomerase/epimerase, partial [Pirellulaceae bacterium]|nr:sugar phosphate isomerase/epimerase [Pirellulaceae bacterium]